MYLSGKPRTLSGYPDKRNWLRRDTGQSKTVSYFRNVVLNASRFFFFFLFGLSSDFQLT